MSDGVWGIIISALSAMGAFYAVIQSKAKVKAEAESLTIGSASKLVETVLKQLDYLDREVEELRTTIAEYRTKVEAAAATEIRLAGEIRTLRRTISQLIDFIEANNLEVPDLEL